MIGELGTDETVKRRLGDLVPAKSENGFSNTLRRGTEEQ